MNEDAKRLYDLWEVPDICLEARNCINFLHDFGFIDEEFNKEQLLKKVDSIGQQHGVFINKPFGRDEK